MFWKCIFLNSQKKNNNTHFQHKKIKRFPLLPTFGRFLRRQVIKTSLKRDAVDVYFCETQQAQKQITVSDLNVGQKTSSYRVSKEEKSLLFFFHFFQSPRKIGKVYDWMGIVGEEFLFPPFCKIQCILKERGGKVSHLPSEREKKKPRMVRGSNKVSCFTK